MEGCDQAFSTFVVPCRGRDSFRGLVNEAAEHMGLHVLRIEWASAFLDTVDLSALDPYLRATADAVCEEGFGRFGRFHVWQSN